MGGKGRGWLVVDFVTPRWGTYEKTNSHEGGKANGPRGEDPAGRRCLDAGREEGACRLWLHVVGALAVFGDVETFAFHFFFHAQTHDQVDELEEDEGTDA